MIDAGPRTCIINLQQFVYILYQKNSIVLLIMMFFELIEWNRFFARSALHTALIRRVVRTRRHPHQGDGC